MRNRWAIVNVENDKITHNLGWWSEADGKKEVEAFVKIYNLRLEDFEDIRIVEVYK